MKRLNEEISLDGKLETISMMDLRMHPGEVLDQVMLGKSFILARNGRPLAIISKLPGEQLTLTVKSNGQIEYSR